VNFQNRPPVYREKLDMNVGFESKILSLLTREIKHGRYICANFKVFKLRILYMY